MEPKTKELIALLSEYIALLKWHEVPHWLQWLEKDKVLIEKSDLYGIEHLLSAFGGMGSLNDLYICKENGYNIEENDTSSVNNRLLELNRKVYGLAEDIRKEVTK